GLGSVGERRALMDGSGVAPAGPAGASGQRNMGVERDRPIAVDLRQPVAIVFRADCRSGLKGRRIARVTRYAALVFLDKPVRQRPLRPRAIGFERATGTSSLKHE